MNTKILPKSLRYVDGPLGFLAAIRILIAVPVGCALTYIFFSSVEPMPTTGEIGFLGIILIGHYVLLVGSFLVGIAAGLLIIGALKSIGMQPCPPAEGDE